MSQDRAAQIQANLHLDLHTALVAHGVHVWDDEKIVDALVGEAMFQIEPLLVEIAALHLKIQAQRPASEALGWPHD